MTKKKRKSREREYERERERNLLPVSTIPKQPEQTELGQDSDSSHNVHPCLPPGFPGQVFEPSSGGSCAH